MINDGAVWEASGNFIWHHVTVGLKDHVMPCFTVRASFFTLINNSKPFASNPHLHVNLFWKFDARFENQWLNLRQCNWNCLLRCRINYQQLEQNNSCLNPRWVVKMFSLYNFHLFFYCMLFADEMSLPLNEWIAFFYFTYFICHVSSLWRSTIRFSS